MAPTASPRHGHSPREAVLGAARRQRQRGQAVAEFLVLCLALIPLFLLTPLIAKYQDIAHATQLASRYIALDAAAHDAAGVGKKPAAQLAQEVRRRFYGNAGAAVRTADAAGDVAAHQNLFWRDPTGAPLVRDLGSDVNVGFGHDAAKSEDASFSGAADHDPYRNVAGATVSKALGVEARGIYTVNVDATLGNLPANLRHLKPFDNINLSIRRHTSVVTGTWAASDPDDVVRRVSDADIFPGKQTAQLDSWIGTAVSTFEVGQVAKPRPGALDLWRDVVPADRRIPP